MSSDTVAARPVEDVPFPCAPAFNSHPHRLAAVATLFGMQPQPVDRCRVLELGCGSGGNLVPMAELHPESTFLGVDSSDNRIVIARQAADALDLKNVEFRVLRPNDDDQALGMFDYVLCHDVFSYVGPEVQQSILTLCKSHQQPSGVAYVNYDTLPGSLLPNLTRRLAREATPAAQSMFLRVAEARKLWQFFSESVADDDPPYRRLLKQTADRALAQSEQELIADLQQGESRPLYFHEFVERAARHQLRYLGDSALSPMFTATFHRSTQHNLRQVSNDAASLEQHIDWLRNRAAHHTLLCHKSVPLTHEIAPQRLYGLFFASPLRPESASPDVASAAVERFVTAAGMRVSTDVPIGKAVLVELAAAWPASRSFSDLLDAANRAASNDSAKALTVAEQQTALAQQLIQCLASGFLELKSEADRFTTIISERPCVSRLARAQAQSSPHVTNRRHEAILLDKTSQNLLPLLDGERNRTTLIQLLMAAVDRGELSILRDKFPATGGTSAGKILEQSLDDILVSLAAYALLIA